MTSTLWYLLVGSSIAIAAVVRLLLLRDPFGRLIAMNIVGVGAFLIILALAGRSGGIDPVLSALVITGLVITAAFTGVAAVLIGRIEDPDLGTRPKAASDDGEAPSTDDADDGASEGGD